MPKPPSSSSSSPYHPAAHILNQLQSPKNNKSNRKRSLKSLVYDPKTGALLCSKATYAQVCQALKHQTLLERVLDLFEEEKSKKTQDEKKNTFIQAQNPGLLRVLLYELLLGPNQALRGGGALKRQLLQHETQLRSCLTKLQQQEPSQPQHHNQGQAYDFPRYVRLNTLCLTTRDIINNNKKQKKEQKLTTQQVLRHIRQCLPSNGKEGDDKCLVLYRDAHVPNLLVVPHHIHQSHPFVAKLQQHPNLLSSSTRQHPIVLQDKSSCFSALCSVHGFASGTGQPQRVYLDACAAPGNKTSHLAALVAAHRQQQPPSLVYALDRSPERCATLKRRLGRIVNNNSRVKVTVQCQDFLKTPNKNKDDELSQVTDILLDPSCSGSGIVTSLDRHGDEQDQDNPTEALNSKLHHRLAQLAAFQWKALMHAMTAFPKVQRIVYSTCSVHAEENEDVVAQALAQNCDWELVAPQCLESWPRRGISTTQTAHHLSDKQTQCLIRVDPRRDETNGFFVACFQRKLQTTEATRNPNLKSDASPAPLDFLVHNDKEWNELPVYPGQSELPTDPMRMAEACETKLKPRPEEEVAATNAPRTSSSTPAMPKKIAKKLEWKRKQRLAKEERIKKKARREEQGNE